MAIKIELIKKILLRNNFSLEMKENSYSFKQVKGSSSVVNLNYYVAIVLFGIGALILYFRSLLAFILLFFSIPFMKGIFHQRKKQLSNFGIELLVNSSELKLNKQDELYKLQCDSIEEIYYEVEKGPDISAGILSAKTHDGEHLKILEFFGDEASVVDDDAKLIAQFITSILNEE